MIKSIEFRNFRNLNQKYEFNSQLNAVVGKNNLGKSNLLDGIKLAFSSISGDYFKISDSDFYNSDSDNIIEISVELSNKNNIASLNFVGEDGNIKCGFKVIISKTPNGRYKKKISLLNGSPVDIDILREDIKIPNVHTIPLIRIEDIYTAGLSVGISNFIDSEDQYKSIKEESKIAIKKSLETKINCFHSMCEKFNENLTIELTDARMVDEKIFIVDGELEHNANIGSGYKSIANIMLNTLNENFNIILIDELENHLHPSLIRTFIRELRSIKNTFILSTTHSSVVINELDVNEIIDISSVRIDSLDEQNLKKLQSFLHPGRNELIMSDNILLVEGYTEELLFKNYLKSNNLNITIINVAGVMFEPYIKLAKLLNKKTVIISDNDKALSDNLEASSRFKNLKELCKNNDFKLIEMDNTLETDLYNNGFLEDQFCNLKKHDTHNNIYIAKSKKKTEIIQKLIMNHIDLSSWHILQEVLDEFKSN